MEKIDLELLKCMVHEIENKVNSDNTDDLATLDIKKSVSILNLKINYYLSNYDVLKALNKDVLGK